MAQIRKEKLLRVLQVLQDSSMEKPVNSQQIINILKDEYDIVGVDRRSIYKDIQLLKDCGYKIKQCIDKKNGWYMDSRRFSDWELKLMMDSVQQARCITVNEAKQLKEKLLGFTGNYGRSRFSHMMDPLSKNVELDISYGEYIETMLEAIISGKKVKFQYTEIADDMSVKLRGNGRIYIFNLYMIYWSDGTYYLIGAHDKYSKPSNYRLDRIINLEMTEERMVPAEKKLGPNPEMVIQKYIKEMVDHFLGETVMIEIEYVPDQITNAILFDFVGKDIRVIKQENGTMKAIFRKQNSVKLEDWFMEYSDRFTVKEPTTLRDRLYTRFSEAAEKYKKV